MADLSDRNERAPRIHVELVDFDPGPVPFRGVSDRFGRGTSARYPDSSSQVDIDKCPLNVRRTHSVTLRMTPLQIHLEAQQNCPPRGVASRTCRTRPNAAPVAGGNLGWRKGGLTNMAHLGRIRRAVKDNAPCNAGSSPECPENHTSKADRSNNADLQQKKQKHPLGKWWW